MTRTIQAKEVTLLELETNYGLQLVYDEQFFPEWQDNLPQITDVEKQRLDRAKASYTNLLRYPPLLENSVKMVILSPLLDLCDFYLSPFHIKSEKSVQIVAEDEGVIVRGNIDVLVLQEKITVVVIESKQASFSVEAGKAQILSYMLSIANSDQPVFGLITNGASFLFIKLVKQQTPVYGFSRLFYLFNPGNELYNVLSILKRLGQLASVEI